MKIILLKEVYGLGHAGDIKEVSDGYGRNFLIPRGLAIIAGEQNLAAIEALRNKQERIKKLEVRSKKKIAGRIAGQKFEIKAMADETGTLYAKIDAKVIAAELNKVFKNPLDKGGVGDFKIEADEIKLFEPIKKIGEYEVDLELGGENGKIKLEVRSK